MRGTDGLLRRVPTPLARRVLQLLETLGWQYRAPGERATCPACRSAEIEHLVPLPLHDRPAGRRVGFASGCRHCGLVFANPMPPAEALAAMYSPDGRWGRTHAGEHREARPSSRYLLKLFARVPDVDLAHPPPGGAVLDFGCGTGELLDALRELGWTTHGIEPAVKSAFARHAELQEIPPAPTFHLVVAHHVLEHVADPLSILRALAASLLPGGVIFASVPRLDGLPQHGDFRYCINDRAHVVSYTEDAMATLMGMAGLEAIPLNDPDRPEGWRAVKRLVMLGRKGGTPTPPDDPLGAAKTAFRAWQLMAEDASAVVPPGMSVRAAAALMNFERRAGRARRPRPGISAARTAR